MTNAPGGFAQRPSPQPFESIPFPTSESVLPGGKFVPSIHPVRHGPLTADGPFRPPRS